ncbi:hypothetical protein AALP_AA8G182100 [Arabis alpina]|uniref:Uncharacterized protein n=1 Tax=Arabis alpina TaxID=50452 RepID=A0A087G7T2_ARAAL|nr:hypothetical protein AALP_AA8G182100 [Arabis alpina]
MDFHSLMRRDLQCLCKKNKIPANMTNLAMADALKALEIVEGLDEYMKQSASNAPPHSPTSLAKQPPNTTTRTTRRKTTLKAEPQTSSQLVSRSTSKSLVGEMGQENINKNVAQEPNTNNVKSEANVAKTPAVRSTRKASAATSCSSKVQESKKKELVQSVYSTRRSTRLLEKCMGDLSLKTKENLDDKPEKNEEAEENVSAQEEKLAGSEEKSKEDEVIPGRDLSVSMEKEWKILKNDSDQVDENAGDLVDIAAFDANIETNNKKLNEVMGYEKESENSLVQVDQQEETLQTYEAMCEEGSKKNDNDQEIEDIEVYINLGDIPVMEHATTENNDESMNVLAFESSVQVNQQETEQVIEENDLETEKINTFDEETMMDQISGVDLADITVLDAKTEINIEKVKEVMSDEESENGLVQADKQEETLQPDKAIMCAEGFKKNDNEQQIGDNEVYVDLGDNPVLEHTNTENKKESMNVLAFESSVQVDQQETEQTIQEIDSEAEKINTFNEETMMDQTSGGDSETKPEEDNSGVDSESTISDADSNKAVMGSDIADEDMILSEAEGSAAAPASPPLLLDEAKVKTTPSSSPFAAESISVQFPRPSKSTPLKNSALKLMINDENENKENNMEMMMMNVVNNNNENGESKVEAKKNMKKVTEIDEEKLKDVSMRQLVKMVKQLSIKTSNNRPALKVLPGNNQIAE